MKEKLIVKNFGALKDIDLQLKQTMVFVGVHSGGKSTLAKLISIFRDISFVDAIDPDSGHTHLRGHLDYFSAYGIESFFSPDTYIRYECEVYTIEYSEKGAFTVEYTPGKKADIPVIYQQIIDEVNTEIERVASVDADVRELVGLIEDDPEHPLLSLLGAFVGSLTMAFTSVASFATHAVYIPAERQLVAQLAALTTEDAPFARYLPDFYTRFEKAREKAREIRIDFLDAEYNYEEGESRVHPLAAPAAVLPLSKSGSSLQAVVPMVVVVEHFYKNFVAKKFVVEEPELHLHPAAQKGLINFLLSRCTYSAKDQRNELIMTTHSPFVLTALNNSLLAYRTAEKHPNRTLDINQVVPERSRLNPEHFAAYELQNGRTLPIFDERAGVIGHSELDMASQVMMAEFDRLTEIYWS